MSLPSEDQTMASKLLQELLRIIIITMTDIFILKSQMAPHTQTCPLQTTCFYENSIKFSRDYVFFFYVFVPHKWQIVYVGHVYKK